MEVFGFVDYKKPLEKQYDMRTSTYRGNVHITDTMLGNALNAKFPESKKVYYTTDPVLANRRSYSTHHSSYDWKFVDPDEIRNPSLDRRVKFIKPFDECQLRFIKRPIRPATSVSQQDYRWQPEPPKPGQSPLFLPSEIKATPIIIDRTKAGYAKYLDPSATTSRLAFIQYTPQEVEGGIAAKDNITFWNWHTKNTPSKRVFREKDEQMCFGLPAKECPKRRCEFQNTLKHVPHSGMTTEVRDHYVEPIKRAMEYDISHIRNTMVHFPIIPFPKDTEYKIIGSGERTQKYV